MSEEKMVRLGELYGEKGIVVCEHISIDGSVEKDDDGCEYMENLTVYCKECRQEYSFTVLIN